MAGACVVHRRDRRAATRAAPYGFLRISTVCAIPWVGRGRGWFGGAGDLFTPVRTAVTGAKISPPLFETMELLGRDITLARLDHAIAALSA